MVKHGHMKLSQ